MPQISKPAFFRKIGYGPFAEQNLFHESEARFRLASCGRRFGKSTMVARDREPTLFIPHMRGWIVGPTYDLGEKEFRVMWNDLIIGQGFGKEKGVKRAYNLRSGEMYIEMPWGARVEVRSAQHPENLVGESLDWVIMSEAAKQNRDTWERYIRPALSDKRGGADFPTTPEGRNWFYEEWLLGKRDDRPEYESWKFPSWMNTEVFPGGYDDPEIQMLRETTSPEWFNQEIGADFNSFVGRIYGEFDEGIHVRSHRFNPDWPNYIAFDWGFANPLAAVEFQVSPRDTIHVWREHYKSWWRLEEHVDFLNSRINPDGYRLDLTFGDAADPEAVSYVSQHFAPCLALPEAKQNWRQGVELYKRFLKPRHDGISYDEYERPILVPSYFVDPSCPEHIKEFGGYRSKEKTEGKNEANAAGVAQRQADHTLDAMRYALVTLFELGAQGSIRDTMAPVVQGQHGRLVSEETYFQYQGAGRMTTGMRF